MRRASPFERADSHGGGPRFIAIQCIFSLEEKYRLYGDKQDRLGVEPD